MHGVETKFHLRDKKQLLEAPNIKSGKIKRQKTFASLTLQRSRIQDECCKSVEIYGARKWRRPLGLFYFGLSGQECTKQAG